MANACSPLRSLQKVDGERLLKLSEANLRDLGVYSQFRQQTVLHYINHLKAGTAPRQPRSLTEFNVSGGVGV